MDSNKINLPYIVFTNRLDILMCIGPFKEIHDDLKTENDVDNVLYLHQLRVAYVRILKNKTTQENIISYNF